MLLSLSILGEFSRYVLLCSCIQLSFPPLHNRTCMVVMCVLWEMPSYSVDVLQVPVGVGVCITFVVVCM